MASPAMRDHSINMSGDRRAVGSDYCSASHGCSDEIQV